MHGINNGFNSQNTIAEKETVIWNVTNMFRDPFKSHEYGSVILIDQG